jgi:hypothetical protein
MWAIQRSQQSSHRFQRLLEPRTSTLLLKPPSHCENQTPRSVSLKYHISSCSTVNNKPVIVKEVVMDQKEMLLCLSDTAMLEILNPQKNITRETIKAHWNEMARMLEGLVEDMRESAGDLDAACG